MKLYILVTHIKYIFLNNYIRRVVGMHTYLQLPIPDKDVNIEVSAASYVREPKQGLIK